MVHCNFAPDTPYTTAPAVGYYATNTTQQGRYPAHDDAMTSLAATYQHASIKPIMCKYDVIHKPEVHNVSQRRRRWNEPWP